MRQIVALTLVLGLGPAAPGFAENHIAEDVPTTFQASEIEGAPLYAISDDERETWEGTTFIAVSEAWEEIGEVESVLLSPSGELAGVVVEVGGFLGLGDRAVLLAPENLRYLRGVDDDFAAVTNLGKGQIEQLEGIAR